MHVGFGGPGLYVVGRVFRAGSGVLVFVVVGYGCGVIVVVTGANVVPPGTVVEPPTVSVTGGKTYVPQ